MMFKPILYVGEKKKNTQSQITEDDSQFQFANSSKNIPFQTTPNMNVLKLGYEDMMGKGGADIINEETRRPAPLQRPKAPLRHKRNVSFVVPTGLATTTKKEHKTRRQRAKAVPEDELQFCRYCGETKTCEWRRGPDGYKSLCNACGIHFAKIVKKEEKLAKLYQPRVLPLSALLN